MKKNTYPLNVSGWSLLPFLLCVSLALFVNACAPSQQGDTTAYTTYTPPAWAPPYNNIADVPYYYFPDYDMYYDVGAQQYWYLNGGAWVASAGLPARYHDVDLNRSYVVMLNKNTSKPWTNHTYYTQNYPPHAYDHYTNIVTTNRAIGNVPPEHEIVPRAYNENNDRVIFAEHPRNASTATAPIAHHEVPMRSIAPSMPPESRPYNYGSGYKHQ